MSLIWDDAIIDRSQVDVDRVAELNSKYLDGTITDAEKTEWANDSKGALNTSDLERIENNIQLLSDVFELDLPTYVGNIPELPDVSYFANLISNVDAIRATGYILDDTPPTPAQPLNAYSKWNDIEKILLAAYTILTQNFYIFTGDGMYSGEGVTIVL